MLIMMQPKLKPGDRFSSPGCHFEYEVIGAVCQLFDRETLPYPSCSLSWKGKQPSWRRIGKRFIADVSSSNKEVYSVRLLHHSKNPPGTLYFVFTFWNMPVDLRRWWYGK
jgi:hypothetical protein